MRSQIYQTHARRTSAEHGFLEIETPFMVKYTPGGARNFLVPSRLNPGQFYALAESPQIFKQLFMVAGFDRYFQIVRCFRDEDLRHDRQPEFTQIDLEMSLRQRGQILQDDDRGPDGGAVEATCSASSSRCRSRRMTYAEAMDKYGVDKPDLRFDLPLCDVTEAVAHDGGGFRVLRVAVKTPGGIVKALRVPGRARASCRAPMLDKLTSSPRAFGAKGLARARVGEGGAWTGAVRRRSPTTARDAINAAAGASDGDIAVLQFGRQAKLVERRARRDLRLHIGDKLEPDPARASGSSCWLTDSPLFERPTTASWSAAHHPFTSPRAEDDRRCSRATRARCCARAYDLVLNGIEIGGGSIRIHRSRPAGARVPGARPHRRGRAREVRLPARRVQVRPAAPRRHRARPRSPGDAAVRRRVAARRDRVPEDAEGHRPDDRRARRRCRRSQLDELHIALKE